jgi:hypothetical protein
MGIRPLPERLEAALRARIRYGRFGRNKPRRGRDRDLGRGHVRVFSLRCHRRDASGKRVGKRLMESALRTIGTSLTSRSSRYGDKAGFYERAALR